MDKELRILILEDVAADAELMEDEMRQAKLIFVSKRVAARQPFMSALRDFAPDIILADYNLPGFNGKEALKIVSEINPEIPFIFVSGALGEELAIELLKKGATDYVLKNRLAKLAPSVKRALEELTDRRKRKKAEQELKNSEKELRQKTQNLEEANTALKVLLKHRQEDQTVMEEKVVSNVKKLVLPYIEKLKVLNLNEAQAGQLEIIEKHLQDIISPFLRNLTVEHYELTPREIQIASLVREGKTTKEITELLNISATAVDFHRKNIRAKLGIKNDKINLRSFLLSMHSQQ